MNSRCATRSWPRCRHGRATRSITDSAGNLVLAMGPDRDTVVFVAHMDEIGFEVSRIAQDGTVSLRTRGGFFPFTVGRADGAAASRRRQDSARATHARAARRAKGRCAACSFRATALRASSPPQLTAWFGLDSAALVDGGRCRRQLGDQLQVLGASRGDALHRALDRRSRRRHGDAARARVDRAGEARSQGDLRLVGARRDGPRGRTARSRQELGPSVQRVYAIDTFVSSDSPLESSRFADAPIGDGAVSRALDNSSVTPPDEIERLTRLARVNRDSAASRHDQRRQRRLRARALRRDRCRARLAVALQPLPRRADRPARRSLAVAT